MMPKAHKPPHTVLLTRNDCDRILSALAWGLALCERVEVLGGDTDATNQAKQELRSLQDEMVETLEYDNRKGRRDG